ncbi:MAG: LytTR family DNA-binding domain-containing protein [Ignavibacteriales bacterium]|nr:LytTR family DNA-binding domain-containing protein [Ignavibacteriales bacterium]
MKKKLRALLIDDERLARNDLRSLLSEYDSIEVIGEADSVQKAIEVITAEDPDLLFLDIQMPGESGFDLLEKIDLQAHVIFVTAFDEYAIRAFEVDAIDYLLKPVNPERLKTAIERLNREKAYSPNKQRILDYDDAMLLSLNSHLKFLRVNSIVSIQSAGDYSEIITSEGKKGLIQKSMTEWEQRLPEKYFCRIHRSTIVNIEFVTKIDEWFGNSYQVHLKGIETPLTMSRRYAALLKQKKS